MKYETTSFNTKKMLADTLVSILKKKPLSKISISEIVSTCQINRKTFYYHFADIYELLEWHFTQEINTIITPNVALNDINSVIQMSTDYMEQNSYIFKCIDDPYFSDKLMQFLIKIIQPLSIENLTMLEKQHQKELDSDYKYFLSDMLTKMTALSIIDTLKHKNNYDIERIQLYLSDTLNASMEGFFSKI